MISWVKDKSDYEDLYYQIASTSLTNLSEIKNTSLNNCENNQTGADLVLNNCKKNSENQDDYEVAISFQVNKKCNNNQINQSRLRKGVNGSKEMLKCLLPKPKPLKESPNDSTPFTKSLSKNLKTTEDLLHNHDANAKKSLNTNCKDKDNNQSDLCNSHSTKLISSSNNFWRNSTNLNNLPACRFSGLQVYTVAKMNRNVGYYYDTDGTAPDTSLMSCVSSNCPNSGVCGASSVCNNSSGDGICGNSTTSTQLYEGNYSAAGGSTITSNRLPNIYLQQNQRLIFPPPPPAPPPPPLPPTPNFLQMHHQLCQQPNRLLPLMSPCKTDFATLTNYAHSTIPPTNNSFSCTSMSKRKQTLNNSVTVSSSSSKTATIKLALRSAFCAAKWNLCALFLLFITIFVIIYFFQKTGNDFESYLYYNNENNGFLYGNYCASTLRKKNFIGTPMPRKIYPNELVLTDLPGRQIVYTQFSLKQNSNVILNISVLPHAKIVVYARQTLEPTPASYDFHRIITANRLHLNTGSDLMSQRENFYNYNEQSQTMKSALLNHFMLSGRWFLGFLNDHENAEPIRLKVSVVQNGINEFDYDDGKVAERTIKAGCKYGCFGKGECINGNCQCHPGYSGKHCEETACPVLCSGNGVFNNGKCVCNEGFKGSECELIENWCLVPDCNGHGRCGINGSCVCESKWQGEFCEKRSCEPDPKCSGFGLCHDGRCYCSDKRWGKSCEHIVSVSPTNVACSSSLIFTSSSTSDDEEKQKKKISNKNSNNKKVKTLTEIEEKLKATKMECSKCLNGECNKNMSSSNCLCNSGWVGSDCSIRVTKCLPGCEEHGVCRLRRRHSHHNEKNKNDFACECYQGWNGENCFIEGCGVNNCSNGSGECTMTSIGDWKCVCDAEHFGPNCEYKKELQCDDKIDNDLDGLTDCEDSECCSTIACQANPMCFTVVQSLEAYAKTSNMQNDDFFTRIRFLFSDADANSPQCYADEKYFDRKRISVIRGNVLSTNGGALTGVRVSDVGNTYGGFSITRNESDGMEGTFDLAVNGGGVIRLLFVRQPYGRVVRSFYVGWNQIVNVGDVFLDENFGQKIFEKCKNSEDLRPNLNYPMIFEDWKLQSIPNLTLSKFAADLNLPSFLSKQDKKILLATSVKNGALNVQIPLIQGTNELNLVYSSIKASSHQSSLYFILLGDEFPTALRLVHINVLIAGRFFNKVLAAKTNLFYEFVWDKQNVYGQNEYGLVDAHVKIGYEYVQNCKTQKSKNNINLRNVVWKDKFVKIIGFLLRSDSPFGQSWAIDSHHHFYSQKNILECGDGSRHYFDVLPPVLKTFIGGTGQRRQIQCQEKFYSELNKKNECDVESDAISIKSAHLFLPIALAASPDGSMFVGDFDLIRKIDAEQNTIKTIFKLRTMDIGNQYYFAIDPANSALFISLPLRRQIWQITTDVSGDFLSSEKYRTVVGNGETCKETYKNEKNSCGDNDLALNAELTLPKGIAFDANSNLYLVDGRKLRFVNATTNEISTIVSESSTSTAICGLNEFSLKQLSLEWPTSLAFDFKKNELFVLDSTIIYRINIDTQTVSVIAGVKNGCSTNSKHSILLKQAQAISMDQNSKRLYIVQSNDKRLNQIRFVDLNNASKIEEIVLDESKNCDCNSLNCICGPEFESTIEDKDLINKPMALTVDSLGRLYIADQGDFKIKRLTSNAPMFNSKRKIYSVTLPMKNEIFEFDSMGKHLRTISSKTKNTIFTFNYAQNQLSSIQFGAVTGNENFIELRKTANESLLNQRILIAKEKISNRTTKFELKKTQNNNSNGGLAAIYFAENDSGYKFDYIHNDLLESVKLLSSNNVAQNNELLKVIYESRNSAVKLLKTLGNYVLDSFPLKFDTRKTFALQ